MQVEDEVIERKQFLEEMSKVGLSARMKQEIEGEIAGKLREMKILRTDREKQIESLERLKSKWDENNKAMDYLGLDGIREKSCKNIMTLHYVSSFGTAFPLL